MKLQTKTKQMEKYNKNVKLTDEQRVNMMNLGIGTQHNTSEKDVLKILRKKKFTDFGQKLTV